MTGKGRWGRWDYFLFDNSASYAKCGWNQNSRIARAIGDKHGKSQLLQLPPGKTEWRTQKARAAGRLVGAVPRLWRYSLDTKMSHCGCGYSITWNAKWRKTTWSRWSGLFKRWQRIGKAIISKTVVYNFGFNSTSHFHCLHGYSTEN